MKRGASGLDFIVGINKAAGHSSHTALSGVKRTLGESRVGHAGTLDPFATGVLVALVGSAARLNRYLALDEKSYVARIAFGSATDTDDIEGNVIRECEVPTSIYNPSFAADVLAAFLGQSLQVPPVFSAIKKDGVRSYKAAREGDELVLEPRPIEVYAAQLLSINTNEADSLPSWTVAFTVSKGTYIRSLARDIAESIGTCAHLDALMRLASGAMRLDECVSEDATREDMLAHVCDPMRLLNMRAAFLDDSSLARVINGSSIKPSDLRFLKYLGAMNDDAVSCTSPWIYSEEELALDEKVALLDSAGLKAIYRTDEGGSLVAECVFNKEVMRGSKEAL